MKCKTNIGQPTRLWTTGVICIFLFLFACTKEKITVPPDINPTEVVLLLPESNTSNELILAAEARYVNKSDVIQSHGYLVHGVFDEKHIEKEYTLSTALESGRSTFKIPDSDKYKEGNTYTYEYFVQTDKGLYTSKTEQFSISNINVVVKDNLIVAVGETITVDGDFIDVEDNYDLSYVFATSDEAKIPFEIINSGKSIRFNVPKEVEHDRSVTFRLISKNKNGPYLSVVVAHAVIVVLLPEPNSYNYHYSDYIDIPYQTNDLYSNDKLQLFVGNVYSKYSNYIRLFDLIKDQKGNTFPIGYINGRDTITFPKPLRVIEPDPNEFGLDNEYVHPGTQFEVTGPDPEKFNFYGVTVGGKNAYYYTSSYAPEKRLITIDDISDGDYPIVMNNIHFNYQSKRKIKVRKVNISSSSHNARHTGEVIKLKGIFIESQSYNVELDQNHTLYISCKKNGELDFEVPTMNAGNYQVKVGYNGEMHPGKIFYANTIPMEIKPSMIQRMHPLRARPGSLITIEGQGLKSYQVYIAETELQQTVLQNNKIQFLVPPDLPNGKYRIHLRSSSFNTKNILSTADYLEIY